MLATTSTAGHAWSTVTAVALLRSFIADGNGGERVSRLVETGGAKAKGFHNKGRDGWQHKRRLSMLFAFKRLDMEFRRREGSVDAKKICCQLEYTRL